MVNLNGINSLLVNDLSAFLINSKQSSVPNYVLTNRFNRNAF